MIQRGLVTAGLLLLGAVASCQTEGSTVGTADGIPLKEPAPPRAGAIGAFWAKQGRKPTENEIQSLQAQQACEDLKGQIEAAAIRRQMARFGIAASKEEVDVLSEAYWSEHKPQEEAQKYNNGRHALSQALARVYEKGEDPEAVYRSWAVPAGISRSAWESELELGRSTEYRTKLAGANFTAEGFIKGVADSNTKLVERRKLDEAVDRELAAQDPMFARYLDTVERNTQVISPFESRSASLPPEAVNYVRAKRAEWWKARYAETKVVLNNPALASRCGSSLESEPRGDRNFPSGSRRSRLSAARGDGGSAPGDRLSNLERRKTDAPEGLGEAGLSGNGGLGRPG